MSELGDASLFIGRPEPRHRREMVVTCRDDMASLMSALHQQPGSVTDVIFDGCEGPTIIHSLPGVMRLTVRGCQHFTVLRTQPDMIQFEATGQNFQSMSEQPKLLRAYVSQCSLAGLPHMPCIKQLRVRNAAIVYMPDLPTLEQLDLYDCPNLMKIPRYPELTSLEVEDCPELYSIESMPRLRRLYVKRCDKLATLPELPALRSLTGSSRSISHTESGALSMLDYRLQRILAHPLPRSRISMLNGERSVFIGQRRAV